MADEATTENEPTGAEGEENAGAEGEEGSAGSADKTFTQAELDKIVQDRLARERKKTADYGDLKKKAEAFDASEAEKLSELEKANAKLAELETRAREAEDRARTTSVRADVLAAAAGKSVDPEAVFEFLRGRDAELLELDDDGNPTNTADAVEKLLEKRPYLAEAGTDEDGKPTPGRVAQGARKKSSSNASQLTEADLVGMSSAEINKARHEGRLDTLLGVAK